MFPLDGINIPELAGNVNLPCFFRFLSCLDLLDFSIYQILIQSITFQDHGEKMNTLTTLASWIDRLNEWVGKGAAWVTLGLVFIVFADVIMRYLFNVSFAITWGSIPEKAYYDIIQPEFPLKA